MITTLEIPDGQYTCDKSVGANERAPFKKGKKYYISGWEISNDYAYVAHPDLNERVHIPGKTIRQHFTTAKTAEQQKNATGLTLSAKKLIKNMDDNALNRYIVQLEHSLSTKGFDFMRRNWINCLNFAREVRDGRTSAVKQYEWVLEKPLSHNLLCTNPDEFSIFKGEQVEIKILIAYHSETRSWYGKHFWKIADCKDASHFQITVRANYDAGSPNITTNSHDHIYRAIDTILWQAEKNKIDCHNGEVEQCKIICNELLKHEYPTIERLRIKIAATKHLVTIPPTQEATMSTEEKHHATTNPEPPAISLEMQELMNTKAISLPPDKFYPLEKILSVESIAYKGITIGIFEHNGKEYVITGAMGAGKGRGWQRFFANEVIDLDKYAGSHQLYTRADFIHGTGYVFQKVKYKTRTLLMLQTIEFTESSVKQNAAAKCKNKKQKPAAPSAVQQPKPALPGQKQIRSIEYPGNKHSAGVWQKIINQITPHDVFVSGCLGTCAVMQHKKPAQSNFGIDPNMDALKQHWPALAGTEFVKDDFLNWIESFSFSKAMQQRWFIYLDPPYLMGTRRSQLKLYAHEPDAQWHEDLISWCTETTILSTIHIAISHYPCPEYDALVTEHGWRKIEYQTRTHQGTVTEALYMNYPEPTELHEYTYLGNDRTERQNNKRMATNIVTKLNKLPALRRNKVIDEVRHLLQQNSTTPPGQTP